MDERYWLLATAYNTGLECLQYVSLTSAFKWNYPLIDIRLTVSPRLACQCSMTPSDGSRPAPSCVALSLTAKSRPKRCVHSRQPRGLVVPFIHSTLLYSAAQISETYAQLLNRFSSHAS